MSATIFPPMSKPRDSRIPIPQSPTLLRRTGSLRLPLTTSIQLRHSQVPNPQQDASSLKRGNSFHFMERGERRSKHGAPPGNYRPNSLETPDHKSPKGTNGSKGAVTPQSPSRIRSLSLSLSSNRLSSTPHRSPIGIPTSPKTPPTSPDIQNHSGQSHLDWETESINSLTSVTSIGSCDHASVARNGTTFSGRSMKYVFHCNQHAGQTGEDYLTPTQRVHRQVKKLKQLLQQAKKELETKDSDILKLTKEVVELRLYKAALNSPEEKSNSSDAITVRENNTDEQITPDVDAIDGSILQNTEMTNSYTDSGHFEDYTNSPVDSKPVKKKVIDKAVSVALGEPSEEHTNLILEYEKRLQELVKTHEEESYQLKQKQNDKIEELLQRITDINKRYWELVPELDLAKERIKELEFQLEDACQKLETEEKEKQKQAFLKEEAALLEKDEKVTAEIVTQGPSRISVPELLEELQVTKNELENIKDLEYASTSNNLQPLLSAKEALSLWVLGARKAMYRQLMEAKNKSKIDPEITLQFLKSAVYYFLTDKENSQGHLKAIQSILGFTPNEISSIERARLS